MWRRGMGYISESLRIITGVAFLLLFVKSQMTDYSRDRFGRKMCDELCQNIRGCKVFIFEIPNLKCWVTNMFSKRKSKGRKALRYRVSKKNEAAHQGQNCPKHSKYFPNRRGVLQCDKGVKKGRRVVRNTRESKILNFLKKRRKRPFSDVGYRRYHKSERIKECPSEYTWVEDVSLCYKIGRSRYQTFETAILSCMASSPGGHLAVLNTTEKFNLVKGILEKGPAGKCYWVGAQQNKNGDFVWSHDNVESQKQLWKKRKYQIRKCGNMMRKLQYNLSAGSCRSQCNSVCEIVIVQ